MKAYRVQIQNAQGKKTADFVQFAEDQAEADEIAGARFKSDGEEITMCAEVRPASAFEAELWNFGALVQVETLAHIVSEFGEINPNSGTPSRAVHMQSWPTKIVEGRKYINVDVGSSGRYMVTKDTGQIFGCKGYGVIHTGHQYGTLETVGAWWWGEYRGMKRKEPKQHARPFEFTGAAPVAAIDRTSTPTTPQGNGRGKVAISETVSQILGAADVDGCELRLVAQLDAATYQEVNKILVALGGKWNRGKRAHVFPCPVADVLPGALNKGHAVNTKKALDQFFTPPDLARRMVELADVKPTDTILEPSAGSGNILREIPKVQERAVLGLVVAVEADPTLADNIRAEFECCTITGDFLQQGESTVPAGFTLVLMNPPFANGSDVKHIEAAFSKLVRGGRLVAICAGGPRQREAFATRADYWEDLPEGTFKSEGTNVNTALMVLRK